MTSPQKAKGDKYERDLARLIDTVCFSGAGLVHRAPLSGGGSNIGGGGRADLSGTPDIWVEAKRTERFQPYEAMAQAERGLAAAKSDDMPVVISRRSQIKDDNSLVVMRMFDWMILYRAHLAANGLDHLPRSGQKDDLPPNVVALLPLNGKDT
jgi:hypothetical protein